jgi:ankyrin repeat protein
LVALSLYGNWLSFTSSDPSSNLVLSQILSNTDLNILKIWYGLAPSTFRAISALSTAHGFFARAPRRIETEAGVQYRANILIQIYLFTNFLPELLSEEVLSAISDTRLLEDEKSDLIRKRNFSMQPPPGHHSFARYFNDRVRSTKSTNSKFILAVFEIVEFMRLSSSPKDIQDVCFSAALLGPLATIFRDLRTNGQFDGSDTIPKNHTLAAAAYFGDEALVQELLQDDDIVIDGTSIIGNPITCAAAQGNSRILLLLLNADTQFVPQTVLRKMGPALSRHKYLITTVAAAIGDTYLIRQISETVDIDGHISKLICIAAANGRADVVDFLLNEATRKISTRERRLHKPGVLQKAAQNGHEKLVRKCLLEMTMDELEDLHSSWPRSAYAAAASRGYINLLRILPITGTKRLYHIQGAMSMAAHFGYKSVVQYLLDNGYDLNGNLEVLAPLPRCSNGIKKDYLNTWVTPLLAAVANEQVEMVEFLLTKGLNLDKNQNLRDEAVFIAEKAGYESIVSILKSSLRP